ncbi:MAG: hypothetical protein RIC80_00390 [Cyclobacteriaceae bacterium]
MSYTVPNYMSVFPQGQLDVIRGNLNGSMASVVESSHTGSPNAQSMTYDNNQTVNTVNFVSSGRHSVYTNINPVELTSNVSWLVNTDQIYPSGTKKVNASVVVGSGQGVTVMWSATNICGTSTRNPAFINQYGYSFLSSGNVKYELVIEFEGTEKVDALPKEVIIVDELASRREASLILDAVSRESLFELNQLKIDVKQLKQGVKIVALFYYINAQDQAVTMSERIIIR